TQFLNLYTNLKNDHPKLMEKVDFPKKVFIGNFSGELIAERSFSFEHFLDYIVTKSALRDSPHLLTFLQEIELDQACRLLDERRNEQAIPILENCFRLLNKIYTDRTKCVLLLLCRLVAASTTSPVAHPNAEKYAELALHRYE
ncbi:Sorting nexin-21, partial [Pseudolycoriella hygida]